MKDRPILFSAPMVCAILEGRKTQTRRVMKPQPDLSGLKTYQPTSGQTWGEHDAVAKLHDDGWHFEIPGASVGSWRCPYGLIGDRLWVRETFQPLFADGIDNQAETDWKTGNGYAISYPATDGIKEYVDPDDNLKDACMPSIHMPRWASRITLEITGIRVERLNDISEADAEAEGIETVRVSETNFRYVNYLRADREQYPKEATIGRPVQSYATLWESINGPGSWAANPWVWVVEFKGPPA